MADHTDTLGGIAWDAREVAGMVRRYADQLMRPDYKPSQLDVREQLYTLAGGVEAIATRAEEARDQDAGPDRSDAVELMAAAIRESCASWERGESCSPDARDLVHAATRALGIGTDHAEHDEQLVDDFYAFQTEGRDERELASWLWGRLTA